MEKMYALAFALLLTLLAVPGAQAGASKQPPTEGRVVRVEVDPVTQALWCIICSDDMTLCVKQRC